MRSPFDKAAIAVAGVCVVVGTAAAAAEAPPSAAPQLAGVAASAAGPGGRVALSRWTLATDPSDRGLARGWRRGRFSGRTVTVPNDVDPIHVKGSAGQRNYQGSVAWYRTRVTAPAPGVYAFAFASANYRASAYVVG